MKLRRRQPEEAERRLADYARGRVRDRSWCVHLSALSTGTWLRTSDGDAAGRSVLILTRSQLLSAVSMVELDGLARRIVLAPPDISVEDAETIIEDAEIDSIVTDYSPRAPGIEKPTILSIDLPVLPRNVACERSIDTEWVLLTSGTSGRPKMVVHSLSSLTGAISKRRGLARSEVWSTFYDIRRYGGLQIFLRAVIGGGSLVLNGPDEPIDRQLARLGSAGVTSISGTPSHWRRVLMCRDRGAFAPRYIRLSGEIADQVVLDALRAGFPNALIGHAYASSEAGVGFTVDDGKEGFPAALIDEPADGVEIRVVDGALKIRSTRTATGYVGASAPCLLDSEGYVDTDDLVERRGDRYYFVGRRSGIINVGGLKVNPEEVEAVLNGHPAVQVSRVTGRKNPLTGAIVVADVVAHGAPTSERQLGREILAHCQQRLDRHKLPAIIRFVERIDLSAGGKLKREFAQN
jgi:acyl-CoA synthetase (AMP-forming)/AMP-acid ligase II